MTEIEEKAYKYYKRINEDDLKNIDTFGEPTRTRIKYMQTLLNQIQNQEKEIEELKFKYQARKDRTKVIIEKQQKEIDELSIIKNSIKTLETHFVNDDTYYVITKENFLEGDFSHLLDDYISKDVIEKKIEELEDLLDLAENDSRVAKYKISALKEEIEDFKDLLK